MRSWIILTIFGLILFSLSYCEIYLMNDFYPKIDKITQAIREDIKSGVDPNENIVKLFNTWEKYKPLAFVFSNHEEFEFYDDHINAMQEYQHINNPEYIYYKSIDLENVNNELRESLKFKIENIF